MMKKKDKILTNEQKNQENYLPNVKNPHNDLFHRVFSSKDKSKALFKKYLPSSTLDIMKINSIETVDSNQIPELGISLYHDLVYKFRLKNKSGFCYTVFEHQSKIDYKMPFRFLRYDVSILLNHLDQGHKTIPILKNILFYTGSRTWKPSTKFDDYYDDPAIGSRYLHVEEFTLIKLPNNNDHPDYIDPDLGYCLAAFKCGMKRKKAYEEFKKFKQIPAFRVYFDNLPIEERILAGTYIAIFVGDSKEEQENLLNLIITNEQEKEEIMRTLAQKYQEEGIEIGKYEGIKIGKYEGIKQVAENMLSELHLDLDTVQKVTGLTKEDLQRIIKK